MNNMIFFFNKEKLKIIEIFELGKHSLFFNFSLLKNLHNMFT